jgi:hypothetical protein
MKVTVEQVKRYPHSRLIVRVDGKVDSIHYEAWIAYKRAEYLRKQAIDS